MALTLIAPPAAGLIKLKPAVWDEPIRNYAAARAQQKMSDAAARAAERVAKPIAAALLDAMGGKEHATAAICGSIVLTAKRTAASSKTITLADGSVIPWDSVTSILVGNRTIAARDVAKLYGGRDEAVAIECTGAGL